MFPLLACGAQIGATAGIQALDEGFGHERVWTAVGSEVDGSIQSTSGPGTRAAAGSPGLGVGVAERG